MENMTFDKYIKIRMNKVENALIKSSFPSYTIKESAEERDFGKFVNVNEKRCIEVNSIGFNVLIAIGEILKEGSEINESGDSYLTSGFVTNIGGGLQIRLIFTCTKSK